MNDSAKASPLATADTFAGELSRAILLARLSTKRRRPSSQFEMPEEEPNTAFPVEDRWIRSEFSATMNSVESSWNNLDIYTATQALKTFGTGVLPSHWLEMAKTRLYDGDIHAAWTIHSILKLES